MPDPVSTRAAAFKLIITQLENDAFNDPAEVARILRKVATDLEANPFNTGGQFNDYNGNYAGLWMFEGVYANE